MDNTIITTTYGTFRKDQLAAAVQNLGHDCDVTDTDQSIVRAANDEINALILEGCSAKEAIEIFKEEYDFCVCV